VSSSTLATKVGFMLTKIAFILTMTIKNNIYIPAVAKTRNFYKMLLNFICKW